MCVLSRAPIQSVKYLAYLGLSSIRGEVGVLIVGS
jgi:hypothetical protein